MASEGDFVAIVWHGCGTNSGAGNGLPATGRRIEGFGITVWRFVGCFHWIFAADDQSVIDQDDRADSGRDAIHDFANAEYPTGWFSLRAIGRPIGKRSGAAIPSPIRTANIEARI